MRRRRRNGRTVDVAPSSGVLTPPAQSYNAHSATTRPHGWGAEAPKHHEALECFKLRLKNTYFLLSADAAGQGLALKHLPFERT